MTVDRITLTQRTWNSGTQYTKIWRQRWALGKLKQTCFLKNVPGNTLWSAICIKQKHIIFLTLHEHVNATRTRIAPESAVTVSVSGGDRGTASTMPDAWREQTVGLWRPVSTANKEYTVYFKHAERLFAFHRTESRYKWQDPASSLALYLSHDFRATHVYSCSGSQATPLSSSQATQRDTVLLLQTHNCVLPLVTEQGTGRDIILTNFGKGCKYS